MKKVTLAAGVAIFSITSLGSVFAQTVMAKRTDVRVLVPKAGGALPTRPTPERAAAAPAPVSAADKSALVASIKTMKPAQVIEAPSRSAFVLSPTNLDAQGTATVISGPVVLTPDFASFRPDAANPLNSAGSVWHVGAADGAWLIDCVVSELEGTAPFQVGSSSVKNGAVVAQSSGEVSAANGHVMFGVYFTGGARNGDLWSMTNGNLFLIGRRAKFRWHSCTATPV